jgi:lipopolysaccharide/colanic/teichoic acid biosynthesis glycosyltransferase
MQVIWMKEAAIAREGPSTFSVLEGFQGPVAEPVFLRDISSKGSASGIRPYAYFKRSVDFLLALFGLLITAPVWVVIIAAIKLSSPGPVFYFQERFGQGGRIFKQWKFRSMVMDAEKETGPVLASERDPRITAVGWLLRKTAMDELPQLLNILAGDMSFVGPRPERPYLVDNVILRTVPNFHKRHVIRPGLTGLAQVYGRYNTSPRDKLRYDLLYVENYSFFLDVKLFFISIWITLKGKWQDRGKKF